MSCVNKLVNAVLLDNFYITNNNFNTFVTYTMFLEVNSLDIEMYCQEMTSPSSHLSQVHNIPE